MTDSPDELIGTHTLIGSGTFSYDGAGNLIRTTFPDLDAFRWQDGYGAFTVSKSQLLATITYVERQRERHQTWSFQQEYRTLLERHGIQYNERFMLD